MRSLAEILAEVKAVATGGARRWPVVRTGQRELILWPIRLSVYIRDDYRCKVCGVPPDRRRARCRWGARCPVSAISDRCYHVPTSPGQSVCTCLDELMWLRLLVELLCRRLAQLERQVQAGSPQVLTVEATS